jgi:hypothetical protein
MVLTPLIGDRRNQALSMSRMQVENSRTSGRQLASWGYSDPGNFDRLVQTVTPSLLRWHYQYLFDWALSQNRMLERFRSLEIIDPVA